MLMNRKYGSNRKVVLVNVITLKEAQYKLRIFLELSKKYILLLYTIPNTCLRTKSGKFTGDMAFHIINTVPST